MAADVFAKMLAFIAGFIAKMVALLKELGEVIGITGAAK